MIMKIKYIHFIKYLIEKINIKVLVLFIYLVIIDKIIKISDKMI